jgi:hypothetical protein
MRYHIVNKVRKGWIRSGDAETERNVVVRGYLGEKDKRVRTVLKWIVG